MFNLPGPLRALASIVLLLSACGPRMVVQHEGDDGTPPPPPPPSSPAITLSAGSLRFTALDGGAPPTSRAIEITNGGGGTLGWNASIEGAPWLAIAPASGTAPSTLDVSVNATGLTPGAYVGTITFSAEGASNSPLSMAVTVEIVPDVAFAALEAQPVGAGYDHATATADFNGDGRPDLAVTNDISGTVSILLTTEIGSLGAKTDVGVGIGPRALAVGDFDGNATSDLAVANTGGDSVTILLGRGDGSFGSPSTFAVGDNPVSITVADLDGDGDDDLAVANVGDYIGPNTVSVLLGSGTGTFGSATSFPAGYAPSAVVAGDFDGDAILDLAVADYDSYYSSGGATLAILKGDGAGSFAAAYYLAAGYRFIAMAASDLDRDGKVDLALASETGSGVTVLMGTGPGGLAAPVTYPAPGSGLHSIAVGDFDGDGLCDLALTANCTCDSSVYILLGTGGGAFGAATSFPAGGPSVSAADFDLDGRLDLAAADWGAFATLSHGRGDGTFMTALNLGAGKHRPQSVAVGDFDRNGSPDVALVDASSSYGAANDLSLWLNDGAGGFGSPATYAVTLPLALAAGDVDHDGNVDVVSAGSGAVSILRGSPAGTLGPATNFVIEGSANFVAIDELSGDGYGDLVVSTNWPYSIQLLRGDGTGAFGAPTSFAAGSEPHSIALGDLDGDGRHDLVVANRGSGGVSVLLATGDGTFSAPSFFYGAVLRYVELADFDADGRLDLVNANYDEGEIRMGRGDGTFGPPTTFPVGGASGVTGDFNGDGKLDVALTDAMGSRVSFLLGAGDGSFFLGGRRYAAAHSIAYDWGAESGDIAAADFNGDGKLDLVSSNADHFDRAYMSVLLRR